MGEWVIGAFINLFGSIAINFGTNLLKLGHDERERHSVLGEGINGKTILRPIISFQSWRIGILFFAFGNALNFISFGYAAQSLLAALGSVQFVSNIVFAYFVLNKTVTVKVLVATTFIVLGNTFLVAFGNHQSPVYTQDQLAEKYSNITFLFYCLLLIVVVVMHHYVYRRGELLLAIPGKELMRYWKLLLPFSFAVVSGAIGSCSVLFAKSLSNLLRLSMSSSYRLDSWFTLSILLLFLCTAGFWVVSLHILFFFVECKENSNLNDISLLLQMARLNEGLAQFDAILIVPMFQIAWTFFSICTGFVYFQEYQVLDTLRTVMFILGMISVFIGISLLAPDDSKGGEVMDSSLSSIASSKVNTDVERLTEDSPIKDMKSLARAMSSKALAVAVRAKSACTLLLGMGDDTMHASSVLAMPMVSSKITGFRGVNSDRSKMLSLRSPSGWNRIPVVAESVNMLDTSSSEEE